MSKSFSPYKQDHTNVKIILHPIQGKILFRIRKLYISDTFDSKIKITQLK